MPFLIELFTISVTIGKYVSTESIRTLTGIQELMADFFLFKDFMTFFTSFYDTSFKWNFSAILSVSFIIFIFMWSLQWINKFVLIEILGGLF